MVLLGVNIDHVATVRQARLTVEPDPVHAAFLAEMGGADGITIHLREDRRHINDRDVRLLSETVKSKINFEMACTDEMVNIAIHYKPATCCLVPEKRQELTTEGGLDILSQTSNIAEAIQKLHDAGIQVSLFIDPDLEQIKQASILKADYIELHTGTYADATTASEQHSELNRLYRAAECANDLGIIVNAGHGLDYRNIAPVLEIQGLHEVNIGHSIIARSIFIGLENAVREMKDLIYQHCSLR